MNFLRLLFCSALAVATVAPAQEKLIVVNEGTWQADNGRLSYFEDGTVVSNKWFRDVNGTKIGDTPNDIIQINDELIAIAVNWSNIVQFIRPDGKAVAATEDIPNNRRLATDGKYVYVTSYAHECMVAGRMTDFEKGFVAKIDISTFKVVAATEVGYEPDGITYYKGKLFVVNTGGYAFQEGHDYEHTVSVVDAATMKLERDVDVEQINLYGKVSRSGRYMCISSPGDYYEVSAATIILDCQRVIDNMPDSDCFVRLPYAATYNTVGRDGTFYALGSQYSYISGDFIFNFVSINPSEVIESGGASGVEKSLPGTIAEDVEKFGSPYGIYVNPYTGYYYATDAGSYQSGGALHQWNPEGQHIGSWSLYINPGSFLALPPDGHFSGIEDVTADRADGPEIYYNLQGIASERAWSGINIVRTADGNVKKIYRK